MYLLVKVIIVAVDGGPETLSSGTSSNNNSGYLLERDNPCVLHIINQKIGKALVLLNLESLPFSGVVVFWIRDILATDPDRQIRITDLRIRILLFSSLAFKMPAKYELCCLLLFKVTVHGHQSF
jgi:hypothetical protein